MSLAQIALYLVASTPASISPSTSSVSGWSFGFATSSDPARDRYKRASIFLQQAETVRLATSNNGPTPVTGLTPTGDVLLVRSTGRGTHVGRAIGGRVAER